MLLTAVGAGFAGLGALLAPQVVPLAGCLAAVAGMAGYALIHGGTPATAPGAAIGAGAVVAGHVDPAQAGTSPEQRRRGVLVGLTAGVVVAVATVALAGMLTVLGDATGPLLVLAAASTAPWGWSRLRPRAQRYWIGRIGIGADCPTEPSPGTGPRPLVQVLESLSTPALCTEWQRSYRALHHPSPGPSSTGPGSTGPHGTGPAARREVVELRRRYLDELTRRDPAGVARWLAAESRPAATSPAPHLTPTTTTFTD